MRLLLLEDEHALGQSLSSALTQSGFQVEWFDDGRLGELSLQDDRYDAVILDLGLPGRSGHQVLQSLRTHDRQVPVLVLTARDSLAERVSTLNEGADDFLAKPFSYLVLVARLRALLRRGGRERPAVLEVGDLRLDPAQHQVWRGGTAVDLTPRQFSLLELLMRRPGEVLSKAAILEHVWDFAYEGDPNIVEVYVRHLRNKVDRPFGRASIETVRGAGYRLAEDGG